MATVILTISNSTEATRVGNLMAARHGYTGFEADGTTAQTKLEFMRKYLMKHVYSECAIQEAETQAAAARVAAILDINTNITIT